MQLKRSTQRNIRFSELWMHRLVCRAKSTFLPDNPCREVGLAESRFMNGELLKNNPVVIFQFNEELLP